MPNVHVKLHDWNVEKNVTGVRAGRLQLAISIPPLNSNALGYLRVMFAVEDIDEIVERLRKQHGAQLVGEIVQYEDSYRLCYMRGPEGLLIGLAQQL